MPLLPTPAYQPPKWQFNGHLQTILPSLFRKVEGIVYRPERIETPDGDFLDLFWSQAGEKPAENLILLTHGLEGDAHRHYILGMVNMFNRHGWDALAWNARSCSPEINRLPRFYHHGDTSDLAWVAEHAIKKEYKKIVLIGFSMGGSLSLRYVAERGGNAPANIFRAIGFSVPCDLASSVKHLSRWDNQIYEQRFLRKLDKKIRAKAEQMPGIISATPLQYVRHFRDFDNSYTAPLHGYIDADDFYKQASVKPLLENIAVPVLLLTAKNDPFLTPDCFPSEIATRHACFYAEFPEQGGHVGFALPNDNFSYAERRAWEFVSQDLPTGEIFV
jgi:uncharacterized protein